MKNITRFLTEGQTKKATMKFRKFLNWYNGEAVRKVTKDLLYDDLGWDYMEDDLGMSLEEIAKLFNDNLNTEVEFTQEDLGNCISIEWDLAGKHFGVDATGWIGSKLDIW